MASRIWGLNRRHTVIAFGATIVIGVLVGMLLGGNGTTSSPTTTNARGPVAIAGGTPGARHAVWTFGFETLRFDDRLRHPQQLTGVKGFGSVFGVGGRTYMYDAASGRIGVLRSASNRLETLGTLPHGVAPSNVFAPTIAVDGDGLWLVSAPGQLTHFDLKTREADAPIDVGAADHPPVATGVVARAGVLFTATQDDAGITVARIDGATHRTTGTTRLDVESPFTLDGVAVDGAGLWIVAAGTAHEFDPADLTARRTVAVGTGSPGAVQGAVAAGHAVWLLGDNGATLVRIDTRTATLSTALKILPRRPSAFHIPAALATDGHHVWAMVQRRDAATDHSVRIVGYDARRRAPTPAVDLPSELFFGGLAAT